MVAFAETALLRREEVLAYVIERIVRSGTAPSEREIAHHMGISRTRVQQLVRQLIDTGVLQRVSGSQRGLWVRDVTHSREIVAQALRKIGFSTAEPLGVLDPPCPHGQLSALPPFEHVSLDDIGEVGPAS